MSHAVVLRGSWAPQPPAIAQSSHGAAPEPRSPLRRNAEARRDAKFRDTFGSPHVFLFVAPRFSAQYFERLRCENGALNKFQSCFQSAVPDETQPPPYSRQGSSPIILSLVKGAERLRGSLDSVSISREDQPPPMKPLCCARDATCGNVMRT